MTTKKTFTIRYVEPQSLKEALDRKERLGAEVEQIQVQLGERPSDTEWRSKAKIALLCKTEELRLLKNYIREQNQNSIEYVNGLKGHLDTAMKILVELEGDGVDITEKGRSLLRSLGYLPIEEDVTVVTDDPPTPC